MTMRSSWITCLTAVIFLLISSSYGVNSQRVVANDLTSSSVEDQEASASDTLDKGRELKPKYDPSLLDILGSDYFDDDKSSNEKSTVVYSPGEGDKDSNGGKGVPVEPVVEEEVVTERPFCTGCPVDVNPEDAKILDIALFAFKSYAANVDGGLDRAQSFVRVVKAKTQVVAGFKYILEVEVGLTNCTKTEYEGTPDLCQLDPTKDTFICDFEVLEQSWLNNKEVLLSRCHHNEKNGEQDDVQETEVDTDIESDEFEDPTTVAAIVERRKKRDTRAFGATKDAEENKETLMEMAKFAIEQLDRIDEDNDARLVIEVVNAKKQTVSGWLYHLKIRVAQTTCQEGTEVTIEKCKDKITLPYTICNVKVLFQPWQTVQRKVTESQCYPETYKKSKKIAKKLFKEEEDKKKNMVQKREKNLIGGFASIDPNSEELSKLVEFVVLSLDEESNAMNAQKLVRVIEAQKQVVNGIKTKLVIELGYTNCRKHRELERSKCDIDEQREHQLCNVTVWERSWLNSTKITNAKCGKREETPDSRKKRGVTPFSIPELNDPDQVKFGDFMTKFTKNYEGVEEYKYRLGVFKENMKKVKLLQENEQGTATYGATVFADLTEEEFSKRHLGLRPDLRQHHIKKMAKVPHLKKLPEEFDWRHYNVVTPVKNQGSCGSCWAFSVTGNIEGSYALKYKNLVSFSEQELVDCDTLDEGCNGGLPENAYKALEKIGGLETETAYPYDGRNDKCQFTPKKVTAKVKSFVQLPKNETDMAAFLVKRGPLSIGINANAMQFYFGGVSHPWKFLCSSKSLDHGVLIVGYGVHTTSIRHKTMPYWIVKNSWGPGWGEQGYYRVYRGDNTCGVAEMVTSAQVA